MALKVNEKYLKSFIAEHEYKGIQQAVTAAHNTLTEKSGLGSDFLGWATLPADYDKQEFTVNSSPYAVEVYRHLGFEEMDQEQTVNGIRFIPMKYEY